VNPNARKRLTDATLIALAAMITTGRPVGGGTQVIIPPKMITDIPALAYDRSRHIARKARLDTAVTA
jgi:hypothetical protein